jgi:hypothetical protein
MALREFLAHETVEGSLRRVLLPGVAPELALVGGTPAALGFPAPSYGPNAAFTPEGDSHAAAASPSGLTARVSFG